MPFTLDQIVPWGRSFGEYVRMFSLTDTNLEKKILGCGDGPASFNAAMHRQGKKVVSADPLYQFSGEQIRGRVQEAYETIMEQLEANQAAYTWTTIRSPQDLGRIRLKSMEAFLRDFERGKTEGRYPIRFIEGKVAEVVFPANFVDEVVDTAAPSSSAHASNLMKEAKLACGLTVSVPLFIKVGERESVETRTHKYLHREAGTS